MIASAGTFTTSHPIDIALKTPKVGLHGVSFAFDMECANKASGDILIHDDHFQQEGFTQLCTTSPC